MERPMSGGPSAAPMMSRPPSPMRGGLPMPGGTPTPLTPPMSSPFGPPPMQGMAPLQQFIQTLIAAMPHLMALQQMAQRQGPAAMMGAPMGAPVGAPSGVSPMMGKMMPPGIGEM